MKSCLGRVCSYNLRPAESPPIPARHFPVLPPAVWQAMPIVASETNSGIQAGPPNNPQDLVEHEILSRNTSLFFDGAAKAGSRNMNHLLGKSSDK